MLRLLIEEQNERETAKKKNSLIKTVNLNDTFNILVQHKGNITEGPSLHPISLHKYNILNIIELFK